MGALKSREKNILSSGSFLESPNALPIPKFTIETNGYQRLVKKNFLFKTKISHGWLDKGNYTKAPFLHGKSLFLKNKFSENFSLNIGITHMVIWGGSTILHGSQPSTLKDFMRIFFGRPGSKSSIPQEQNNA